MLRWPHEDNLRRPRSLTCSFFAAKERLDIPAAVKHAEYHHILPINAVTITYSPTGKLRKRGTQIITFAANKRICSEQIKPFGKRSNETLSYVGTPALLCDVIPDLVKSESAIGAR